METIRQKAKKAFEEEIKPHMVKDLLGILANLAKNYNVKEDQEDDFYNEINRVYCDWSCNYRKNKTKDDDKKTALDKALCDIIC